jgi:hypothetical protein
MANGTGSGGSGGGSGSGSGDKPTREDDFDSESKKLTPPKKRTWDSGKDTRSSKSSGKYPNQQVIKTRSGHSVIYDDSKGTESLTIQHRSGAGMQFMPNGAIQMTAHNGKYDIVFGENRMTITGANDLTVKGDGSLRVYGDFRKTVHGNVEYSATESMVFRGKNIIHAATENYSTVAQTTTIKSSKNAHFSAKEDLAVNAGKSASFVGRKTAHIGGTKLALEGVDILSAKSSQGKMQLASAKEFTHEVGGKVTLNFKDALDQTTAKAATYSYKDKRDTTVEKDETNNTKGDYGRKVDGTHKDEASTRHINGPPPGQAQQAQTASLEEVKSEKGGEHKNQDGSKRDFA